MKETPAPAVVVRPPDEKMARIYVGAGRTAGIQPQNLVGAITGGGIKGSVIGAIEISDRFSIVELPESMVGEVLGAMRNTLDQGEEGCGAPVCGEVIRRRVVSPGGAAECSPRLQSWEKLRERKAPEGRKNSFAPPGLLLLATIYPRLKSWATFCRRSAAEEGRSPEGSTRSRSRASNFESANQVPAARLGWRPIRKAW